MTMNGDVGEYEGKRKKKGNRKRRNKGGYPSVVKFPFNVYI